MTKDEFIEELAKRWYDARCGAEDHTAWESLAEHTRQSFRDIAQEQQWPLINIFVALWMNQKAARISDMYDEQREAVFWLRREWRDYMA